MSLWLYRALSLILLLGWLTACVAPSKQADAPQGAPENAELEEVAVSPNPKETHPQAETNPSSEASPPAALVEDLKTILATEFGIPSAEVWVREAVAVEWSDSCLGASRPDELCAQVITPGYRIILSTVTETFEFHTDRSGRNVRRVSPTEQPRETEQPGEIKQP